MVRFLDALSSTFPVFYIQNLVSDTVKSALLDAFNCITGGVMRGSYKKGHSFMQQMNELPPL